jgi:AcrR family transcriptional regulator
MQDDNLTIALAAETLGECLTDTPVFDTAKRQQIMEGARRVFLDDGFDGASIGDIVRAAGVSKGTLYAYFPSKEKLFEALVIEDKRKQAEVLFVLDEDDGDVARVLRRLGASFIDMLVQPEALAFARIVIGASAKFPEIGKAFYDAGPCVGTARLGSYLGRLSAKGVLSVDDPEHAARQFLDLCKTGLHLRMMLGDPKMASSAEVDRNLDSAIKVFLAAYGPDRRGDRAR